jgi:hypothetical protein
MHEQNQREGHLRTLANRLQFTVEKTGDGFTLARVADVSSPVREEHLTIEQAEALLEVWKLRGNG